MSEMSQEKLLQIAAAAEKLVRCKGRYHSEQNYRALAALFGVTTPDLPPLEGEALRERAEPVVPDALEQFAEFMTAESIKAGDYPDGWQCKAANAAHDYAQDCRAAPPAPVATPDLHKVVYHFRDLNEGFPVERFKADYVIAWMLANYPPAPVVPVETFEEWSRRCEIQLTLCRPEFREVAEITWNACRAAMLAAPGKDG